MVLLSWIRLVLGVIFLLVGMYLFAVQIYGVFRFGYVLNRMHAAAMGDTLGIGSSMLGLMLISGWNFTTLKMGLIILFLWCSSPVSSHLISRLQSITDPDLAAQCEITDEIQKKLDDLTDTEEE